MDLRRHLPSATFVVVILVVIAAFGGIFIYMGVYNIGADAPHSRLVYNALEELRERAIRHHSRDVVPPSDLNDPKRIAAGAGLYNVHRLSSRASAKIEPRASLVWASSGNLAVHVGYARYASAPPLGEEPAGARLPDERDDYFDAGIQQKLGAFTVGLDGYWRSAHNYIAEHRTIGSAVPLAFGLKRARMRGLELSGTYARRGTTAWANLSLSKSEAKSIIGDSLFLPASIAAAANSYVPLANDRPVTASAGLTQRFGKLSLGGDVLVSSGTVRTLGSSDPNGDRHAAYADLGLAAVYHATIANRPADIRLDLANITNVHYATSDATNLEGGWTRWGRGRAITIGIEQGF